MINQEMRTRHSVNQVTMRPAHVPLSKKKHPNRQGETRERVCAARIMTVPPQQATPGARLVRMGSVEVPDEQ